MTQRLFAHPRSAFLPNHNKIFFRTPPRHLNRPRKRSQTDYRNGVRLSDKFPQKGVFSLA
jgi:hypothetical protein